MVDATEEESWSIAMDTELSTDANSTPGESAEKTGNLPKDRIFELLSVRRRRDVLTYLDKVESETTLSAMAEHIAAKENEIEVSQISAAQRKRVYIGLYQCHLPTMDDANVINFDQDRGTIELRAEAEQLFPYLYLDQSND